jgi:hypothetical protein
MSDSGCDGGEDVQDIVPVAKKRIEADKHVPINVP